MPGVRFLLVRNRLKVMKLLCLTALSVVLLLSSELVGKACVCANPRDAREGLSKAKAVFSGKVIKPSAEGWVFEVERVWKGKGIGQWVIIKDYEPDSTCGWGFSAGESYLLFANTVASGERTVYIPQVCNFTSILSRAGKSLKLIGKGKLVRSEHKPPRVSAQGKGVRS
jgi:hypothetical protein